VFSTNNGIRRLLDCFTRSGYQCLFFFQVLAPNQREEGEKTLEINQTMQIDENRNPNPRSTRGRGRKRFKSRNQKEVQTLDLPTTMQDHHSGLTSPENSPCRRARHKGHCHRAVRRRRAHPRVNARAGEGAGDGAAGLHRTAACGSFLCFLRDAKV
jgi:hypothetical protein